MKKRYYVFGDSMMRGVMPDETGSYHASELIGFPEIAEKCEIEIINYAMPTFTTERVLGWAQSTMARIDKPDAVIIECGGNDCDYDWKIFTESAGTELKHRRDLEHFSNDYEELISFFENMNVPVIAAMTPHIATGKYLSHLKEVSADIQKYSNSLPSVKLMKMAYNEYEKRMYEIANRHNCDIIVLQNKFDQVADSEDYFSADGMHPNERGYQLIGQSFLEFFSKKC